MSGDYSRFTFDPLRHYAQVRMQQGRVQLDADWNEQAAIDAHARASALRDLVGSCGVPKGSGAFLVSPLPTAGAPVDLAIGNGRCYVEGQVAAAEASAVAADIVNAQAGVVEPASMAPDGVAYAVGQWLELVDEQTSVTTRITAVDQEDRTLTVAAGLGNLADAVSVRRIVSYCHQPHDPAPDFVNGDGDLELADGNYLVYLDAWEREVTGLDDPRLLEPALGGADTATRVQSAWRIGLAVVDEGVDCEDAMPASLTEAPSGRMNARTRPPETQDNACQLPPTAGYRRLENQLYRVEVQRGGNRATARIKWSRDNGIVATRIDLVDGRVLSVADVGRDQVLGFADGQWVEISSERSRLRGEPHDLYQIESVDAARRQVTLTATAASLAGEDGLQLRRWDQTGADAGTTGLPMDSDWMALESGIEVQFSEGTYRAGDYWLIPARTATGDIEWPPYEVPNTHPVAQPPHGVAHSYCRLAMLTLSDGVATLNDCRHEFPPLTGICADDVCFDNSACDMPDAETVQDAIDALCARPSGGNPIVTGVVVFAVSNTQQTEFVSGFIDTGLGPGPLQVVLGLEQGRNEPLFVGAFEVFDAFEYPAVFPGAEIRPQDGSLRIAIRIQNPELVGSSVRVRWWATQPAADAGEVRVGPRPTIGPTIVPPTILPTILPTIAPTLVPPTIAPTVLPTISPTFVPPTLAPTGVPTVRPTVSPTLAPVTRVPGGTVPTRTPIVGLSSRPLTDVNGVGPVLAARLTAGGITDAAALANADAATVAPLMGVSEVRARTLVESARSLLEE
ncbi:MAG: hypothetical protein H6953_12070 [Chromatiaceae bacterium]|nr:hypothetical protein [Chromatiaceae bacterium]MCP5315916.1 hypothetical protein [Chromatiaceae bacterium]